jgi:type IV pilus assembly protein PilQ
MEIDLSDVIVVEDTSQNPAPIDDARFESTAATIEVVEIPQAAIEGVSIDLEVPRIPVATQSLPSDMEIVLEIPGQGAVAPGQATLASEETISVDFPDEDVRTILRNVADLFELNLVIPDTLQGRTSIKLRNITWRQAFEVVLDPLGFTYVEDRNIIRIKSIEDLTTEPVDTRVFIANYARAGDLQNSIAPLVDTAAGGRIQVDVRSNALVITERPSRMNKIQEIIETLDRATDQVMIESKFIEITNTDTKNVGVNWASLSGYSASAGPFQRGILNTDASEQILVDGRELSINKTTGLAQTQIQNLTSGDVVTDTLSDLTTDTALFSADQFEVILSALNTQDDVKLVSNPTVVTLNNTKAKIAIGERYPIPQYTFNAETGQRQLDEIEFEDIGITLEVTPQVNNAGFINLEIIPEVSSSDRFAIIENTEIPIIDSRRTETNIMIKDGYTLAIGGLVENQITKRNTSVPILGSLPGVGRLFSSESDSITQRNLIIFITAKTLNPDGSTYRDIIDPRVLDDMGLTPSELPGYDLSIEEKTRLDLLEQYRIDAAREAIADKQAARIQAIEYQGMQVVEEVTKPRSNRRL